MSKPTLSRIAANGLRELRDEHGIEATPDEIVRLHELGKQVENPSAGERLDLIGNPVRCGNAWLWPLSVAASIWYSDRARLWFSGDIRMQELALAFAMAHGRGDPLPERPRRMGLTERLLRRLLDLRDAPLHLADLRTREDAVAAVSDWASRLGATQAELEAAIEEALGGVADETPGPDKPPLDWASVVRELALLTNTDPDRWTHRASVEELVRCYSRAVAIDAARRGLRYSVKTDLDRASEAFRREITAIIKAHAPAQESAP